MMKVKQATRAYEAFLHESLPVVEADLALKHKEMTNGLFPFLRSTFYRFSALFREACADLSAGPHLLAVGDLHVENFGTWRDLEGRLIWGINDVDEAQDMPYAIDLVRLAVSAMFASDEAKLGLPVEEIAASILQGYQEWLDVGGKPYVLEEDHGWLRTLATGALRQPTAFWEKITHLPDAQPPAEVVETLRNHLPKGAQVTRFASRTAGLGSLGRPRYVVLATAQGGNVTREAKAMLPSAWNWALDGRAAPIRCGEIVRIGVRCADPWLDFITAEDQLSGWVIRRLAPLCSRVELTALPYRKDELRLLRAMGRETANLHLGSKDRIAAVQADLAAKRSGWLAAAAVKMAEATRADWGDWRA